MTKDIEDWALEEARREVDIIDGTLVPEVVYEVVGYQTHEFNMGSNLEIDEVPYDGRWVGFSASSEPGLQYEASQWIERNGGRFDWERSETVDIGVFGDRTPKLMMNIMWYADGRIAEPIRRAVDIKWIKKEKV